MNKNPENPKSSKWRPGDVIGKRYKLESVIGHGGFGCVLLAIDQTLNRKVAVKTVYRAVLSDNDIVRFQKEAQALARIKHPNVVDVYDFGVLEDGNPFLVMEYITGDSLEDYYSKNQFDLEYTLEIFEQICQGIKAVHNASLVHRDIKATNLIVAKEKNNVDCVKLLDFGIARGISDDDRKEQTISGVVEGTPLYMSPEQGKELKLDKRSDLYSLGCLFYRMLTGSPPFLGNTGFEIISKHISESAKPIQVACPDLEFPPGLNEFVEDMMAKEPEERISSIELVLTRLYEFTDSDGLEVEPDLTVEIESSNRLDPDVVNQSNTVFDIYSKANRKVLFAVICLLGAVVAVWGFYLFESEKASYTGTRSIFGPDIKPTPHSFIYNGKDPLSELKKLQTETKKINTLVIAKSVDNETLSKMLQLEPENVAIFQAKLTDENWQFIGTKKTINNLGIFGETTISENDFKEISGLHLDKVTIYSSNVTDECLKALSASKSIQALAIGKNDQITLEGAKPLLSIRSLINLNFDRCKNLDRNAIEILNGSSAWVKTTGKKFKIEQEFTKRKNYYSKGGSLPDDLSNLFFVQNF